MKLVLNFAYCRLTIAFVIFKKAIVPILVVIAMEFGKRKILMKNSISLQNFKQI